MLQALMQQGGSGITPQQAAMQVPSTPWVSPQQAAMQVPEDQQASLGNSQVRAGMLNQAPPMTPPPTSPY
jgi:hypothetical protein